MFLNRGKLMMLHNSSLIHSDLSDTTNKNLIRENKASKPLGFGLATKRI